EDYRGGWGNVIRVVHCMEKGGKRSFVESLYAHCEKVQVKTGDWVKRGQQIGTVGTAWGKYKAHLHLEIRDKIGLALGGGYSENTFGLVNPSEFIKANRSK
ncbi:MAG: M23 family metallopeptidase, partial [Bacteroidia bacterium]